MIVLLDYVFECHETSSDKQKQVVEEITGLRFQSRNIVDAIKGRRRQEQLHSAVAERHQEFPWGGGGESSHDDEEEDLSSLLTSCVTKACSIVEAVVDLNSTSSDLNQFRFTSTAVKKADLMEPSFEKYVTVKRGGCSLEEQESSCASNNLP
ncbi:hypothetical protein Bca101_025954 [Brassica carinata]